MPRKNVSSGAKWEPVVGYSRAVATKTHVYVSGTTGTKLDGTHVAADDAYAQAKQALVNIGRALTEAGATFADVVRTRIYVTDIARDWEAIGRAHGEVFAAVRPATSMVEVRRLIEDWMRVEIEADAVLETVG